GARDRPGASWPARADRTVALGRVLHVRPAARIRFCRRAGGGRLAAVVHPDRLAVLQCGRGDWAVGVRRSRDGRDGGWLARGTTASSVATGLALAHRAVCHWRARELLAGRTSRRVLTTGHVAVKPFVHTPSTLIWATCRLNGAAHVPNRTHSRRTRALALVDRTDRQTGVRSDDGEGSGGEPHRQSRKRRGRIQELPGEPRRQRARSLVHGPGVRAQKATGHREAEGQSQQQE